MEANRAFRFHSSGIGDTIIGPAIFRPWRVHRCGGDYTERLRRLLDVIEDRDLFLAFLFVGGCTVGKSTEPLDWFFAEFR